MKTIEGVNQDSEFREYMSAWKDARKIMNSLKKEYKEERLKKGIEQCFLERTQIIALFMLKANINIGIISKCTELTIEQIENMNISTKFFTNILIDFN